ncbi:MAG: NAD(P)-binding domain-containing protein, partial [Afipia sp.]|nr:NAD(P)-binding domain-containing protein [Afipia sp.]
IAEHLVVEFGGMSDPGDFAFGDHESMGNAVDAGGFEPIFDEGLTAERRAVGHLGALGIDEVAGLLRGLGVAFGLFRHGIKNTMIFDQNPPGRQGPWRTYARNHLLRTRKDSTGGLDWGIPSLHFIRWSEARYGRNYYESIQKIPRTIWADYLDWFAGTTDLPTKYETAVRNIRWNEDERLFEIDTSTGIARAEFVVMCTGIESGGKHRFPRIVQDRLPVHVYAHTMTEPEIGHLKDKDVVVIGGGASAFDWANAVLSAGAKSVDLMLRRKDLPSAHRVCWGSRWIGYHRHYIDLPDEMKWSYSIADLDLGVPPAVRDPRFRIFGKAGIDDIAYEKEKIVGVYGGTELRHDFMICGTGSNNSIFGQSELQSILPHIQVWKDVFTPIDGRTHPELELSPYLGRSLQFTPKRPEDSFVERNLSGFRCNLSAIQFVAKRVCDDISKHIFLEHQHEVKAAFDAFDEWEE